MTVRRVLFFENLTACALLFSCASCAQEGEIEERSKTQATVSDPSVFINEIHYDNVGTDAGEAVEIAGPAGTDLSAFSLVLYNGANGLVYNTRSLSGVIPDQQSGYGTLSFSYPSNGIQNGSPDGIALVSGSTVLSFISYEGTFTAVGGPADGLSSTEIGVAEDGSTLVGDSLQLIGSGTEYSDFTWQTESASSFGSPNAGQTLGAGGDGDGDGDGDGELCGDPATPIASVQGSAADSPLVGLSVSVEGVVIGDFQGGGADLGGFFVQSMAPDTDPQTSEGVFVHDGVAGQPVNIGDHVRITGVVSEYYGLTQISTGQVQICGESALPEPTPVALPFEEETDLEAVEGMLVQASDLTVTEVYDLGRYGEVSLSAGGRLFNFTNGNGAPQSENARRRIILDDAKDAQNYEPIAFLGQDETLRIGDSIASITAVMSYGFGAYRLEPVDRSAVTFDRTNPRTSHPEDVGGDLKVASLNVLNYFTTLGDRGADTALELERQRQKLVDAVLGIDADILGLMEIENNEAALDDFVAAINEAAGTTVYERAPDPEFTGTDAIRTALIYKTQRVNPIGAGSSDPDPVFSRPPIANTFSYRGNLLSVVVNHFKSKGSCPSDPNDENADRGQGCWNALRSQQAARLVDFVGTLQVESGDPDVVVLGDLNSYLAEDPITTLQNGGLNNRIWDVPVAQRYSYVYFGESGVLDYAMTTPSLEVTGTTIWHINADEPLFLDYNTEFNPVSAYQPNAYRSSDHDPIIIGISLPADPEAMLVELRQATESVLATAKLRKSQELRLLVRLQLAASLMDLGSKSKWRALDALERKLVTRQLDQFIRLVDDFLPNGEEKSRLTHMAGELISAL